MVDMLQLQTLAGNHFYGLETMVSNGEYWHFLFKFHDLLYNMNWNFF